MTDNESPAETAELDAAELDAAELDAAELDAEPTIAVMLTQEAEAKVWAASRAALKHYRIDLKHYSTHFVQADSDEAALEMYRLYVPVPEGVEPVVSLAKPL